MIYLKTVFAEKQELLIVAVFLIIKLQSAVYYEFLKD